MALMTLRQRQNIMRALSAVHERAVSHSWSPARAAHMAVMVVNCGLTESVWHVYGNVANGESQRLADRKGWGQRWIGSDHDSVGCFQQRVPMWGTTHDCMEPKIAAQKFMDRAAEVGADDVGNDVWHDIQSVQVSYDPSGGNYRVNTAWAHRIVRAMWDPHQRNLRGTWRRNQAKNWRFSR